MDRSSKEFPAVQNTQVTSRESRGGNRHRVRRTRMFGAIPDLSLSNDIGHYEVYIRIFTVGWPLWVMSSVIFERELKARDLFANDQDSTSHFWCESFRIATRNNGFTTLHQNGRHQSQPQFRGILPPSDGSVPPSLPPSLL